MAKIIWTRTDEAPLLATYSLKPIVEAFASRAGIDVDTADISLAGRILAQFPDRLGDKKVDDALAQLGELAKTPEANIIKLPNISASVPQLKAAIKELQEQGDDIPDDPSDPSTDEEKDVQARYANVLGSAVNPVLREGNSDRRAPQAVKNFARKHPHTMGAWDKDSRTNVATLGHDDFRTNEQSVVMPADDTLTIQHVATDGSTTVLKDGLKVLEGEIVDATFMSAKALDAFLAEQVQRARDEHILFSAHLKATMMKVSDPIIFGHIVRSFFSGVFERHGEKLAAAGIKLRSGLMETQARELNRAFFSRIERGRPWLRVKLGISLDGRTALANGESQWITSPEAREDVHRWRARCGALLTGAGTVLADDPHLTVRLPDGAEFVPPISRSTPSRSNHSRARDEAISALFW